MIENRTNLEKLNADKEQAFRIFDKYGSFVLLDEEGTQEEIQFVNDYISSIHAYDPEKSITSAEYDAENILWVEEKRKRSELKEKRRGRENTIEHFFPVCNKHIK